MTTKKGLQQQQQLQQRTLLSMFTPKKIDVVESPSSSLLNSTVMKNNDNNNDIHNVESNQIEKNPEDIDTTKDTKENDDDTIQVATIVSNESVTEINNNNISPDTNQTSANIKDNKKNVVVVKVESKTSSSISSSDTKPCIVKASNKTNTTQEQNVLTTSSSSSLQQQQVVVDSNATTTNGSVSTFQVSKTCTPQDFVNQLAINMFDNNMKETKSFLDNCLQSLHKHDNIPKETITTNNNNNNDMIIAKLGKLVFTNPFEISCIQPRGKFLLSIYEYGIILNDIKMIEHIIIPSKSIKHLVIFPKPEDCKNKSTIITKTKKNNDNNKKNDISSMSLDMILLVFKDHSGKDNTSIVFKNKTINQICFQLPNPPTNTNTVPIISNNDSNGTQQQQQTKDMEEGDDESLHHDTYQLLPWNQEDIISKFGNNRNMNLLSVLSTTKKTSQMSLCWSKQWMIVLSLSLEYPFHQIAYVENPTNNNNNKQQQPDILMNMIQNKKQFVSNTDEQISTTTSSLPYVTCYLGVQDGVLYPMEDGLLFYKPPCYYPRSMLNSIICSNRGSSTSGNRYLDLTIQLTSSTTTNSKTATNTKKNNKNYMDNEIQFSNIDKAEEKVLQNYIHSTLIPAMQRDVSTTTGINDQEESNDNMIMKSISTTVSNSNDSHGTTELNNDNDNSNMKDTNSSSRQLRHKRKASQMAREMNKATMSKNNDRDEHENESDDDDEDFEIMVQEDEIEEDESTDDDDDSDDDVDEFSPKIVGDDDMDSTEDDDDDDDDTDTECSN